MARPAAAVLSWGRSPGSPWPATPGLGLGTCSPGPLSLPAVVSPSSRLGKRESEPYTCSLPVTSGLEKGSGPPQMRMEGTLWAQGEHTGAGVLLVSHPASAFSCHPEAQPRATPHHVSLLWAGPLHTFPAWWPKLREAKHLASWSPSWDGRAGTGCCTPQLWLIERLLSGAAPERQGPQTSRRGDVLTLPPSVSALPKSCSLGSGPFPRRPARPLLGLGTRAAKDSRPDKLRYLLRGWQPQDQGRCRRGWRKALP